jgi:hypothetical protein
MRRFNLLTLSPRHGAPTLRNFAPRPTACKREQITSTIRSRSIHHKEKLSTRTICNKSLLPTQVEAKDENHRLPADGVVNEMAAGSSILKMINVINLIEKLFVIFVFNLAGNLAPMTPPVTMDGNVYE